MKKTDTYTYFPVLLDLRRLPCLVVGGGRVALMKVRSLVESNATITVVSPKLCAGLAKLSKNAKISVIPTPYSSRFLKGQKVVFCATDNPEINRLVSHDCRRIGILLNVADGPSWCDFILPANLKRGDLVISVSSQGKAPFFAKEMRRKLAEVLPPSTAVVAELAGEFRKLVLSNGRSRDMKDKAYGKFLSTDWDTMLRTKGQRKSREYLDELLLDAEEKPDS